jgi:hypothetical protein
MCDKPLRSLFSRSERRGECFIFQGSTNSDGYGQIWNGNKTVKAHRLAYSLSRGCDIDSLDVVMHTCDNPACVCPWHLVEGTVADNVSDMSKKGRHGRQTLSLAQVKEIAADTRKGSVLAKEYGVSKSFVSRVKSGKLYSDVDMDRVKVDGRNNSTSDRWGKHV